MGMCLALPWKTVSMEPSLISSREPSLTCQGPRCRASLLVKPLGRKPGS